MSFKDEYEAAGVPMLPVVAQDVVVARQVVLYSWATVATSLTLVPVASMGWIYLVVAVLSGGLFLVEAHKLLARAKAPQNVTAASLKPMRLFHYSISYLTILFLAVAVDPLLHLAHLSASVGVRCRKVLDRVESSCLVSSCSHFGK